MQRLLRRLPPELLGAPAHLAENVARYSMSRPGSRSAPTIATPGSLTGRKVVLTGASSGIGEVGAQMLAAAGAEVIMVARRQPELEALHDKITEEGGAAHWYCADLSREEDRAQLIETITAHHGTPDVLVNNAARSIRRYIRDSVDRVHDYERTMALNYLGPVHLTLGFLTGMRERRRGHIVNVSTSAAMMDMAPRFSAYAASKRALAVFGETLAAEERRHGIAVTTLYYPLVATPMAAPTAKYDGRPKLSAAEAAEWILHAIKDRPQAVAPRATRGMKAVSALMPGRVLQDAMVRGT